MAVLSRACSHWSSLSWRCCRKLWPWQAPKTGLPPAAVCSSYDVWYSTTGNSASHSCECEHLTGAGASALPATVLGCTGISLPVSGLISMRFNAQAEAAAVKIYMLSNLYSLARHGQLHWPLLAVLALYSSRYR